MLSEGFLLFVADAYGSPFYILAHPGQRPNQIHEFGSCRGLVVALCDFDVS